MNTLHMTHPGQALILIPHLIGFHPENSVFLLAVECDKRPGILGPLARFRLDDGFLPPTFLRDAIEFVTDHSAATVVVAWFGDDMRAMLARRDILESLHDAGMVLQELLDATYQSMSRGFVSVLVTDGTYYGSAQDIIGHHSVDLLTARGDLRLFQELEETPLAAELVYTGSAPLTYEPTGIWERVGYAKRRLAVEQAREGAPRRGGQLWNNSLERAIESTIPLMPGNAAQLLGGKRRIGKLNAALRNLWVRDRVLLKAVDSQMGSFSTVRRTELEPMLERATRQRPDRARVQRIIDLLQACASYSADDDAAAYAVSAYLYWWLGDSAKARDNAHQALESDPQYSLAQLVSQALAAHLPPPWYEHIVNN
ncbi:MAG: DUF4192 family protein [Actinomycetaceae bacterium]|nr:DUF4192 family protein [Actinomycetaceae bacterium]